LREIGAARLVAAFGQPEVEDFDEAVGRDHNIGWLEIAVDDAALVRRVECIDDLPGDRQHLSDRQSGGAKPVGNRRPFD